MSLLTGAGRAGDRGQHLSGDYWRQRGREVLTSRQAGSRRLVASTLYYSAPGGLAALDLPMVLPMDPMGAPFVLLLVCSIKGARLASARGHVLRGLLRPLGLLRWAGFARAAIGRA